MTDLHVAIYRRAEEGKLRHWAIWLQTFPPEESVILQVTDNMYGYGYCIDDPIYASPFHTEKIESVIYCGSICRENHDRAVDAILHYPVHNRGTTWNCQSWVLECWDLLVRMGFMNSCSQGIHCVEFLRE